MFPFKETALLIYHCYDDCLILPFCLQIDLRDSHYQRERDRQDSHYSSDYFEYERQAPSPTDPRYSYDRGYPGREDRYSRDERYSNPVMAS